MSYQVSDYAGDEVYCFEATGNCCVGDEVCFERATFSGSYKRPKLDGFERIQAKIVADSYGAEKQQHTFTLELANGSKTRIKGRNLYANGVWRKPWKNEEDRLAVLEEKYKRGDIARAAREYRKEQDGFSW